MLFGVSGILLLLVVVVILILIMNYICYVHRSPGHPACATATLWVTVDDVGGCEAWLMPCTYDEENARSLMLLLAPYRVSAGVSAGVSAAIYNCRTACFWHAALIIRLLRHCFPSAQRS